MAAGLDSTSHRTIVGALRARPRWRPGFVLATFGIVAVVVFAVAQLAAAFLPGRPVPAHGFPDYPLFDGWTRWDSDWYLRIADSGYYYDGPGRQSAVAYFPGYPAAIRLAAVVFRNTLVAGVVVTYLAGAGAAVLFHRWCRAALGSSAARLALLVLLLYPFSFFLFGAVYSDALFLCAALGAFCLLEADRPWLAGAAGVVATASRPVGMAVALGLALRALELRGVLPGPPRLGVRHAGSGRAPDGTDPPRADPRPRGWWLPWPVRPCAFKARDLGVLLAGGGFAAYCALLWYRFDDPFVFRKVYGAEGWARTFDLHTLFKIDLFWRIRDWGWNTVNVALTLQGVITITALLLVPVVIRRFGWGYAGYAGVVILMPAATSAEFLAMGRYSLAAFPCFAAGAALLDRPRLRRTVVPALLGASGIGLAWMTSLFARWWLLT